MSTTTALTSPSPLAAIKQTGTEPSEVGEHVDELLAPVVCDPAWDIRQSMINIIARLSRYTITPGGRIKAVSLRKAARTERVMQSRYGVDDQGPVCTGYRERQARLAGDLDVTRQRLTQIRDRFLEVARATSIHCPRLDSHARTGAPFNPNRPAAVLAGDRRNQAISESDIARFVSEVLGGAGADKETLMLLEGVEKRRAKFENEARAIATAIGATPLPLVLTRANAIGSTEEEATALCDWLPTLADFEWVGGQAAGWFSFGRVQRGRSQVIRFARQLLSVCEGGRIPVSEVVALAQTHCHARVGLPVVSVAVPPAVVRAILQRAANLELSGEWLAVRSPLDARKELDATDFALYEEAMRRGGALRVSEAMNVGGFKTGVALSQWLRRTAIFRRADYGVIALRFATSFAVNAAVDRRRERWSEARRTTVKVPRSVRFTRKGGVASWRQLLGARVVKKPVIEILQGIMEPTDAGEYEVAGLSGLTVRIVKRSTGRYVFVGLVRPLQFAGCQIGDVLTFSVDTTRRVIEVSGPNFDASKFKEKYGLWFDGRSLRTARKAAVGEPPRLISFERRLAAYNLSRKLLRVPHRLRHWLTSGVFRLRGGQAVFDVAPRAHGAAAIVGLVQFLIDAGAGEGTVVRLSFDLETKEVDVVLLREDVS